MQQRALVTCLAALWSAAAFAQDETATPPADAEVAVDAAAPGDDAAVSGDDAAAPAEDAEAMPLPVEEEDPPDVRAPLIEDLAVAAGNPNTPPMITAVITDDWSGIETATFYYRIPGEVEYRSAQFSPGTGGLFIARLPDGTQSSGFQYYVEVYDAAKNGPARLGSALNPFEVGPADMGTLERMERERIRAESGPVHPAWMMLSLGSGILAGAGSGAFLIDIVANVNPNIDAAETLGDTTALQQWESARLTDATAATLLGVLSVAGFATGAGLLIYSAVAE